MSVKSSSAAGHTENGLHTSSMRMDTPILGVLPEGVSPVEMPGVGASILSDGVVEPF